MLVRAAVLSKRALVLLQAEVVLDYSATLEDRTKSIADYWADFSGSNLPAGEIQTLLFGPGTCSLNAGWPGLTAGWPRWLRGGVVKAFPFQLCEVVLLLCLRRPLDPVCRVCRPHPGLLPGRCELLLLKTTHSNVQSNPLVCLFILSWVHACIRCPEPQAFCPAERCPAVHADGQPARRLHFLLGHQVGSPLATIACHPVFPVVHVHAHACGVLLTTFILV